MVAFNTLASSSIYGYMLMVRLFGCLCIIAECLICGGSTKLGVYLISFNGVTVANHQQFYFSHYSIGGILTLASKIHPDSSTVWQYSQVEL